MGKITKIVITFANNQQAFNPGSDVVGSVSFQVDKTLKVKEITATLLGWCKTKWKSGTNENEKIFRETEEYCLQKSVLWGSQRPSDLAAGSYQKTFRFKLPEKCPSTFSSKHGNVCYMVEVHYKIPGVFSDGKSSSKTLIVNDKFNLLEDPQTSNLCYTPLQIKGEQIDDNCLWVSKASLTADVTLDKEAYSPGETMILNGNIFNGSNSKLECRFSLTQNIVCYGHLQSVMDHRIKSKEKKIELAVWESTALEQQERRYFQNQSTIKIPTENVVATSLRNCGLIEVNYHIKLFCITDQFCPNVLEIKRIKVVIGYHESNDPASTRDHDLADISEVVLDDVAPSSEVKPPSYEESNSDKFEMTSGASPVGQSTYYDWGKNAFTYS